MWLSSTGSTAWLDQFLTHHHFTVAFTTINNITSPGPSSTPPGSSSASRMCPPNRGGRAKPEKSSIIWTRSKSGSGLCFHNTFLNRNLVSSSFRRWRFTGGFTGGKGATRWLRETWKHFRCRFYAIFSVFLYFLVLWLFSSARVVKAIKLFSWYPRVFSICSALSSLGHRTNNCGAATTAGGKLYKNVHVRLYSSQTN